MICTDCHNGNHSDCKTTTPLTNFDGLSLVSRYLQRGSWCYCQHRVPEASSPLLTATGLVGWAEAKETALDVLEAQEKKRDQLAEREYLSAGNGYGIPPLPPETHIK